MFGTERRVCERSGEEPEVDLKSREWKKLSACLALSPAAKLCYTGITGFDFF